MAKKKPDPDLEAIDRAMARKPIEDGGPAFPRPSSPGDGSYSSKPQEGMSLRDFFAGQALVTAMHGNLWSTGSDSELAALVYRIADALIAERRS